MTATFILSLDCEGRWGVADGLSPAVARGLTDARLRAAYRSITDLLDRHAIASTFAFVGTFTWNRDSADLRALDELAPRALHHFQPALADLRRGGEGWLGSWAVDLVEAAGMHELALHGTTHLPWGDVDEDLARDELALLPSMPRLIDAQTYVFPRNQVRHAHLLAAAGLSSWRAARPMSRLQALASEFYPFPAPDAHGPPVPAGRFVNWRSGPRRLVPPWLSRMRARSMLASAARTGGVVHYWTHPENVATAPDTLDVLAAILEEVSFMRQRGLVRVQTQRDYIRDQAAAPARTVAQARPAQASVAGFD